MEVIAGVSQGAVAKQLTPTNGLAERKIFVYQEGKIITYQVSENGIPETRITGKAHRESVREASLAQNTRFQVDIVRCVDMGAELVYDRDPCGNHKPVSERAKDIIGGTLAVCS